MFDITSSKLLLLAIVALLVIGPKDFPLLLRTIGKYVGIIRGHAKEFRAQFDEFARESELSQLKKDVQNMAQETEASLNATGQSVEKSFQDARQSVEGTLGPDPLGPDPLGPDPLAPDPLAHDANGLPLGAPEPAPAEAAAASGGNGAAPAPETPAPVASFAPEAAPSPEPAPAAAATAPAPAPEKTGA
jgi:sec-independent protein translocase protein TatB